MGKKTNMYVLSLGEMNVRRLTYCIGRSHAKLFIPRMNGHGGSKKRATLETIPSSSLNSFCCLELEFEAIINADDLVERR